MKKRVAGLLLALCMVLSMVPANVLAVNEFPMVPITQEEPTQAVCVCQTKCDGGNTACSVCAGDPSGCAGVCAHNWAGGVCAKCEAVCGHNWADGVCSVCRAEKTGITRLGGTLNCENQITVVNLFKLTGVNGIDLAKDAGVMVFTNAQYQNWDGGFDASYAKAGLKYDDEKGCYYAESAPVYISDLHQKYWYVGYMKLSDGSYMLTDPALYGPTVYAYNMLQKTDDPKTVELCVTLLNYISAVQKYVTPGTAAENLANYDLPADQKTVTWNNPQLNSAPAVDAAMKGARDKDVFTATGKNIFLDYNIRMTAVYKISDDIVKNAKEAGTVFWTAEQFAKLTERPTYGNFGECTLRGLTRQSAGRWVSHSYSLAAKDISDTVIYYMGYVVMADGSVKYTTVMAYNMEQYIGAQSAKTTALANMCKALYFYERAADAVFG